MTVLSVLLSVVCLVWCPGNSSPRPRLGTSCWAVTRLAFYLLAMTIISRLSDDEAPPPAGPQPHRWPRGAINDLHHAAYRGSVEATLAVLSRRSIDINEGDPDGFTPLMFAAQDGYSPVARILLERGANVSIAADGGTTALHLSAQDGHLAATADLIEAGADLDASGVEGATPLHLACQYGHSKVVAKLVEAGADVDSRAGDGRTPLYMAALDGRLDAVKILLRANANPLLTAITRRGFILAPLDVAANNGHSKVVCKLVQKVGVEGFADDERGVEVLAMAAKEGHVDVVALLTDDGVVDTGNALCNAAGCSRAAAVQFLLQQQLRRSPAGLAGYVNFRDCVGCTPLFRAIECYADNDGAPPLISPVIVRMLVDAGADTSKKVRFTSTSGWVLFNGTALAFTHDCLRSKTVGGVKDADQEQINRLTAVRRLLLRVEAARAASWLWTGGLIPAGGPASEESSSETAGRPAASSTQLRTMLPMLRRRSRGLPVASIFR